MNSRDDLRRRLRARRAAIPSGERRRAALAVARHLERAGRLRAGARIAAYLSVGSELDTTPLLGRALLRGCTVLLPRLTAVREGRMIFVPAGSIRRLNRFGIPEPDSLQRISVRFLSVVYLPLLGFDAHGTRLGSGAGFYDRVLAFRRRHRRWRGPLLIGLAHGAQEVVLADGGPIPRLPTDVPLDAVVTERGIRFFPGENP